MSVRLYTLAARAVAVIHLFMIFMNLISLPLVVIYEPFWIAMPIITVLVSPLIGGSYCMFNNLENYYRRKAGMYEINDRTEAFVSDARKASQEFMKIFKRDK